MSVMNYVSSEIKIIAVKHSLVGTESLNQSAARFGVSRSTLQKWLLNYEMFGTEGLCHRAGNHHYSKEIKREAVEAYLSGRMSEEDICRFGREHSLRSGFRCIMAKKSSVPQAEPGRVHVWPGSAEKKKRRRWNSASPMTGTTP